MLMSLVLGPGIFIPLYGITFVITNLLGKFLFLICLPPRNVPDPNHDSEKVDNNRYLQSVLLKSQLEDILQLT